MQKLYLFLQKNRLEAGCDEAGRGCLAGPVVAAAVIPQPHYQRLQPLPDHHPLSRATHVALPAPSDT